MGTTLRIAGGLALVSLLAGCTSIPLSTLWRMRHFGVEDVLSLEPAELRVAMADDLPKRSVTGDTVPRQKGANMELEVIDSRHVRHAVHMRLVDDPHTLPPDTDQPWRVMRLTDESARSLRQLRDAVRADPQHDKDGVNFNVAFAPGGIPPQITEVTFSVSLRLSATAEWLPLIENYSVKVDRRDPDAGPPSD
jgi:hypothetical protein